MDAVQCAVSIQSNIRKKNITSTRVPGCTTVRVLFSRDNKLNLKIRIIKKIKKKEDFCICGRRRRRLDIKTHTSGKEKKKYIDLKETL